MSATRRDSAASMASDWAFHASAWDGGGAAVASTAAGGSAAAGASAVGDCAGTVGEEGSGTSLAPAGVVLMGRDCAAG